MKILFLSTGPWGTGSFTLIKCLAEELLKAGHQVKIFFPDADFESSDRDEYYKDTKLYHIWHFPIKAGPIEIPSFPLMLTDPHPRNPQSITFKKLSDEELAFYEKELYAQVSDIIQSFKPDIIECQHIWYTAWALNRMEMEYIVTAHHSDQTGFIKDSRVREKAIAGAHGAKKIIAISESVRQEVMDLYHVASDKIDVIPNGYDKNVFQKKRVNKEEVLRDLGINIGTDARIISFAGKLSLTKGIDILLQANKLLDPVWNIHIIVMGAGDLEAICKPLNPDSYSLQNIHFVGQQTPEGVARIHNISLMGVLPSRSEGFGIACLESMACGLPLVVTRSGGPEDFAVGEIIETESSKQLADGILKILNLPTDEYQVLCGQAQKAAEAFSMAAITQKHLKLYESIKTQKE